MSKKSKTASTLNDLASQLREVRLAIETNDALIEAYMADQLGQLLEHQKTLASFTKIDPKKLNGTAPADGETAH